VRKASAARLVIDIASPCGEWRRVLPGIAARCRSAVRAAMALAAPSLGEAEISIVLGDDALLRQLNGAWRDKDAPTNVLSFPAQDFAHGVPAAQGGAPLPLGDVVLALATIRAEAAAQRKALGDHLSHLVVHGVLHLIGFDHVEPAEAEEMEALERRVLARLGIADPYDPDAPVAEASHG
jgi:probable rRNA maturation factor